LAKKKQGNLWGNQLGATSAMFFPNKNGDKTAWFFEGCLHPEKFPGFVDEFPIFGTFGISFHPVGNVIIPTD